MSKDDRGLAPPGGILVDDAAGAASGEAVRGLPSAPRETASGAPAAEGSTVAKPSGGTAEPETGSGPPGGESGGSGAQDGRPGGGPAAATDRAANVIPVPGSGAENPRPAPTEARPTLAAETRVPRFIPHPGAEDNAGQQARVAVRPAGVVARPAADTPEPSLARVLATTIQLWVTRRLRRLGIGRRQPAYGGAGTAGRASSAPGRSPSAWRWRLAAIALAVAILGLVALQLSGALSRPGSAAAPPANPGNGGNGGNGGTSSLSAAATVRNQAAAWIAQEVGSGNVIACDPVMCSALLGSGMPAGHLLPLQSAGANPFGADVIVASPPVRSEYGGDLTSVYAPTLIASFGSGASRVDVRAIAPQGGAAYRAAAKPDLIYRKAAGADLLRNPRFHATAQAAGQITAAQVDSRLLVTLAYLVSQRAVSVSSFSDTGPHAPVDFRQVTITSPGGQTAALTADLNQVRTQRPPYLPDSATIVHPGGPAVLRIEFGAPSLQGLLSGGNSS